MTFVFSGGGTRWRCPTRGGRASCAGISRDRPNRQKFRHFPQKRTNDDDSSLRNSIDSSSPERTNGLSTAANSLTFVSFAQGTSFLPSPILFPDRWTGFELLWGPKEAKCLVTRVDSKNVIYESQVREFTSVTIYNMFFPPNVI